MHKNTVLFNWVNISWLQNNPQLSNMEFGRRLAVERELEKTPYFSLPNACEYCHNHACTCHRLVHPHIEGTFVELFNLAVWWIYQGHHRLTKLNSNLMHDVHQWGWAFRVFKSINKSEMSHQIQCSLKFTAIVISVHVHTCIHVHACTCIEP